MPIAIKKKQPKEATVEQTEKVGEETEGSEMKVGEGASESTQLSARDAKSEEVTEAQEVRETEDDADDSDAQSASGQSSDVAIQREKDQSQYSLSDLFKGAKIVNMAGESVDFDPRKLPKDNTENLQYLEMSMHYNSDGRKKALYKFMLDSKAGYHGRLNYPKGDKNQNPTSVTYRIERKQLTKLIKYIESNS